MNREHLDLDSSVSLSPRHNTQNGDSFYSSMVDMLPNPAFCKDINGVYTACNKAWTELTGTAAEALIGRRDEDLLPSSLARRIRTHDRESIASTLPLSHDIRFPDTAGSERIVRVQRSPIHDATGSIRGILGICTDLTESRRQEQERSAAVVMAAAAEMSIMTIEGMIDPVIILESNGWIERVNKGYTELLGLKAPPLGSELGSILPAFDPDTVKELLERCRREGRVRDIATRIENSDGVTLDVLVNISILRDSRRSIDGFVVVIRDVSSLVEAKEKLGTIINASGDGVALVNAEGRILTANSTLASRCDNAPNKLNTSYWQDLCGPSLKAERSAFLEEIVCMKEARTAEFQDNNSVYHNSGVPLIDPHGTVREIALFSRDITEQKQSEALQRALYSISETAYFAKDMDNLYRMVHRVIARLLPAENFMLALVNPADGELECPYQVDEYLTGGQPTHLFGEFSVKDGLASHLFKTGKPVLLKAAEIEELAARGITDPDNPTPRQCLGVPLSNTDGQNIGMLVVRIYNSSQHYQDSDRRILSFVSSQIAMAIERKRKEEELHSSNATLKRLTDGTILALVKAVELRDPYTAGHQQRVSRLAEAIAGELGLDGERIEAIRIAALLHDIGKISVPSELLSKPGCLSPLEFELIRQHPIISSDLLSPIEFPWPIRRYVLEHHEKLDGSGYPNGLKGDQISLEGRIICVADVMDAMVSHRPYRPSKGLSLALEEIARHAGSLYDPDVVAVCEALFSREAFSFEF